MENDRNIGPDLGTLTQIELEQELELALRDIASIKSQLEEARSRARTTGVYSDPDWYNGARYALRRKSLHLQRLQTEMGRRRRGRGKQGHASGTVAAGDAVWLRFLTKFHDAARRRLPKALVQELEQEAGGTSRC